MNKKSSAERKIENEVAFRQANEKVQQSLDTLNELAKEDGYEHLPEIEDKPIHFYCECSDEDCKERIAMKPSVYNDIHKDRKRFLVKPVHETTSIEKVILKRKGYAVVQKHETPPEKVSGLHHTDVRNT
jgi:hypothetical protein